MARVNIHEAKIIIAKVGRSVARLVWYEEPRRARRVLGRDVGLFEVFDAFDVHAVFV